MCIGSLTRRGCSRGEDDVVALGVDDGAALGASELAAVTYEVAAAAGTVSVEVW